MKSTDDKTGRASHPPVLDDEFDRLREAFCTRMRSDEVRLTILAASLARIEGDPVGIFAALQALAHRIRGAAAIFQATELTNSAHALEQAATNACDSRADHADGAVWSTLEDLVEQLASECGGDLTRLPLRRPPPHTVRTAGELEAGHRRARSRHTRHH